jgi:hypothetical protein
VRGRFASSFIAIMATDRVLRIEQRINRLASARILASRLGKVGWSGVKR